jgi:hypothetical protein
MDNNTFLGNINIDLSVIKISLGGFNFNYQKGVLNIKNSNFHNHVNSVLAVLNFI